MDTERQVTKVDLGDGYVAEYDPSDQASTAYINSVKKRLAPSYDIPRRLHSNLGAIILAAAGGGLIGGVSTKGSIGAILAGTGLVGGTAALLGAIPVKEKPSITVPEALAPKTAAVSIDNPVSVGIYSPDSEGNMLKLLKALKVKSGRDKFTVPKGFISDGCSVPSSLWNVITPPIDPRSIRASIAHDYIYRTQPKGWTQERADKMFKRMLLEDGLDKARANAAFFGLTHFGDTAWNESSAKIEALKEAARNKVKIYRDNKAMN